MGNSVAIIVGQLLGAGKMDEARDTDNKLIVFSVVLCIGVALVIDNRDSFMERRSKGREVDLRRIS